MNNTGRFQVDRRKVLKGALASAAILPTLSFTHSASASDGVIRIGHVSPKTGPLASFGEADEFTVGQVQKALKDGLSINGKNYRVEIISKDSQSNPSRAAEAASQLITSDNVDLMLAFAPDTTSPVSDQCEPNGIPCISTVTPWQPWFFGRGGKPDVGFRYTYLFFFGMEDIAAAFLEMWDSLETNRKVGGLFPNDADGLAFADVERGFPKFLSDAKYKLFDPGRYQNLNDNFSSQIANFKSRGVDIVTGIMIPPDLTTFWIQAKQQGLTPKIATIGKALLFPASVEALGDAAHNLSADVWWSPNHPFTSSLTGATAKKTAQLYTEATGRQWTQPIGFAHALFEVAADALKRSGNPKDREKVRAALAETEMKTLVGPVNFRSGGPVPNVSKTPLVGGQWRRGGDFKYELVITANGNAPMIPKGGKMEALS